MKALTNGGYLLLRVCELDGRISQRQLAAELGITIRHVGVLINSLINDGALLVTGAGRRRRIQVNPDYVDDLNLRAGALVSTAPPDEHDGWTLHEE